MSHMQPDPQLSSFIDMTSTLIEKILAVNDLLPLGEVTHFHSKRVPDISVRDYFLRIAKYAPYPKECLPTILIYLDRLARSTQTPFVLNSYNVHRMVLITLIIAAKFHCDNLYSNSHYAQIGGISKSEFMKLEFMFLKNIKYDIAVTGSILSQYTTQLFQFYGSADAFQVSTPEIQTNEVIQLQSFDDVYSLQSRRSSYASSPSLIFSATTDSSPFSQSMSNSFSRSRSHSRAHSLSGINVAAPSPVRTSKRFSAVNNIMDSNNMVNVLEGIPTTNSKPVEIQVSNNYSTGIFGGFSFKTNKSKRRSLLSFQY